MSDDLREQYPRIFGAVRANMIQLEPELVRYLVHWLGDYIRIKAQPGQSGVPDGVAAAQLALAEAHASASNSSCRHESVSLMAPESLVSSYEAIGTAEAAAVLGISADAVRWHCKQGNLEHRRVGRHLMITKSSVENYKHRKARSA
jgi:excisionase family DNA binding protein